MNTFKLSTLIFALVFGAWLGCGGGTNGGTGGSLGAGGAVGTGGAIDGGGGMGGATIDAPYVGGSGGGTGIEAGGQGGSGGNNMCGATGYVDCTGLTPAQCHDLIINPPLPTIPNCVVSQDPSGAPPPVAYPNCNAI
jgi:hypothetical protein